MKAYHRISGKVRIDLPTDFEYEAKEDPRRFSVVVDRKHFEALADEIKEGDPVRAELKRSLDDALSQIERLSDDRDHWEQEAENWKREAERGPDRARLRQLVEERDRMTAQRDEAVKLATSVETLRPIRMTVPAELFADSSDDVSELKAVVVSQAREIVRLKGECE
ncbi:hypothetical protein [Streptomyces umbrinus]|uniref:hypothetical protein n=1 Tax=Streptomyces umbrinus TaxID=67370 RepID=UPI0034203FDD